MQYNECETCGAKDGRAGLLVKTDDNPCFECQNCSDTRKTGDVVIHAHLSRTDEEISKTMNILNPYTKGVVYEGLGTYIGIITTWPFGEDYVIRNHTFADKTVSDARTSAKVNEVFIDQLPKHV